MAIEEFNSRRDWGTVEALVLDSIKKLNERADSLDKNIGETSKQLAVIAERLGENGIISMQIDMLESSIKSSTAALQYEFSSKIGAIATELDQVKKRDIRAAFDRYEELNKRVSIQSKRIDTVERRTDFIKAWVMGGAAVLSFLWWMVEKYLQYVKH
jgi:capsid protein